MNLYVVMSQEAFLLRYINSFICLKDRCRWRDRGEVRERGSSISWSRFECLQWAGLSQSVARNLEVHWSLSHGWQGPRELDHLLLLSQIYYKELEQRQLKLVSIRNASVAHGFIWCATKPAPRGFLSVISICNVNFWYLKTLRINGVMPLIF